MLAVGNYLNGSTEMGQADGFGIDVLNTLKELQDRVNTSFVSCYKSSNYGFSLKACIKVSRFSRVAVDLYLIYSFLFWSIHGQCIKT